MKKTISILGSTGSIGISVFKIIDAKKSFFKINLLSANKNFKSICKQIEKYKPNIFIISNPIIFKKVKNKFKNKKVKIFQNFETIKSIKKNDITIAAISGIAGLNPTLRMIKHSKNLLIANKEAIICGWNLIKRKCQKNNTKIIPVDSEHFSISQLLMSHSLNEIKKIYLTASGGPFLNYNFKKLKNVRPKDALQHPRWKMGKKISVDSATLMNKMLELIEAQKLFNIPNKQLDIIIHPQSLVHAIVELNNGLVKFIYHETSMIIPLVNAIFEGDLNINDFYKSKGKSKKNIDDLSFKKVNVKTFPVIQIKDRINEYPSTSIIVNACNEILVDHFLQKKIPFLSIIKLIKTILNDRNYTKYAIKRPKNINQIHEIDIWAKKIILKKIKKRI